MNLLATGDWWFCSSSVSILRLLPFEVDCGDDIETRYTRISENSLLVLLPYPNWFFLSCHEMYTDCLNHNFTRFSFCGGRPVFLFGGMTRMRNHSTTDRIMRQKSPKKISRYHIYLLNLFFDQNIKTLFRWKRIFPPLKLETLMATFWVPETAKRPRCITVSHNGSLKRPVEFICTYLDISRPSLQ